MKAFLLTVVPVILALASPTSAKTSDGDSFTLESLFKPIKNMDNPKRGPASAIKDGCYMFYTAGGMGTSVCMSGLTEEGIGGANARLIFFSTVDRIEACAKTSSIKIEANSFTAIVNASFSFTLMNETLRDGKLMGDAKVGSSTMKFAEIDPKTVAKISNRFEQEPKCGKLQPGQLVKL